MTGSPAPESLFSALRSRLPYTSAQWYAVNPKCGAIYIGGWSFHWALDGPVKVIDGKVVTVRERPRRNIHVYHHHLFTALNIPLWRSRAFCEHGFRNYIDWHRCGYVSVANPEGRVPDREMFPEHYDENGVHWMDRTCFCTDLGRDYCSMHAEEVGA